jgi:hypothetical protein
MSEVKNVTELENSAEETFEPSSENQCLLRAVLTPAEVSEVEGKKKQPQAVMTQLHGSATGFKTLDTRVDPATKADLDEDGNLVMVAPVVGGQF